MSGPLDPGVPGLGKIFAAGGYETAYFGKWHLGNDPGLHGFEVHNGGKADDADTTRRAVEFIKDRKQKGQKRRPFFLMASWVNPHDIYEFKASTPIDPERLEEVLLPRSTGDDLSAKPFPQRHFLEADQGSPFRRFAADVWRRYLSSYESLVEKVDAEIGQVVDALEKDGEPGTVIVFTSDHGKQNWRVPIRMVRTKKWKLTRYVRYGEELYDLEKDPDELVNLAGRPEHEAIQKELSSRLDRWIAETGDPFPALGVTDRSGKEVP